MLGDSDESHLTSNNLLPLLLLQIGTTLFGPLVDTANYEFRKNLKNSDAKVTDQAALDALEVQRYYLKLCDIVNDNEGQDLCPSEGQVCLAASHPHPPHIIPPFFFFDQGD